MSESLRKLKKMEQTGKYLFHGTTSGSIVSFEPRQAISDGVKHGEPCVAASEYIEPAIFMAILGSRVSSGWNSDEPSDFGFYLKETDFETLRRHNATGYVYIFDRNTTVFNPFMGWEWRAHENVEPLQKIEVNFADLPKKIELR